MTIDEECAEKGHRVEPKSKRCFGFNLEFYGPSSDTGVPTQADASNQFIITGEASSLSQYALCFRCGRIVHVSGEEL